MSSTSSCASSPSSRSQVGDGSSRVGDGERRGVGHGAGEPYYVLWIAAPAGPAGGRSRGFWCIS
eukprot:1209544-Prymnesium_polylepis.1